MLARLLLVFGLLIASPLVSGAPALAQTTFAQQKAEDLFQLGYGQFQGQEFPQARASFEAALRLDPGHEKARSYLIEVLVLEGDLDAARAVAEQPAAPSEQAEPPAAETAPAAADVPPVEAAPAPEVAPPGTEAELSPEEADRLRAVAAERQAEAQARHAAERADHEAREAEERANRAARAAEEARTSGTAVRAAKEARRERRNPRRGERFGIGLGAGGASGTFGVFTELRPGWVASGVVGVGGFLVSRGGVIRPALAVSGELQLSPLPFRLTPLLGVGLMGLFGSGAEAIDSTLWSLSTSRDNARVVPYALLGARYDFKKTLWFSVTVRLAPSPATRVMPIPGARLGLRF